MFIPKKSAASSPPKKQEQPSGGTSSCNDGPSAELRFTWMLRKRHDYTVEGITADGEPSLTLYRWHGSHWQCLHPEVANKFALDWLEAHAINKYSKSQAKACIEAAATQMMDTATAISSLEAERSHRVIVPLQGQYLELVNGAWHVLKLDPKLGMTFAVPATLDKSRIKNGIYTPAVVPPESRFGKYLAKFIPDRKDQDKLSEIAAASLIPGGMERAFLLLGCGGNGKSTFLHILEAFHPTTHTVLRLGRLGTAFGLAGISGKSLAIAWEVPPFIGSEAEQVLKSLISRDTVQEEKKHRDPINLTPRATIYLAANEPPRWTDHTYGRERKFEAFAFNNKIKESEKDITYAGKIMKDPVELAVVLDWMLIGIARLIGRGGFTERTNSQNELTETIKLESDNVYAYLVQEAVILPENDIAKRWYSDKKAVYTTYREATLSNGQKPVASPQFWRTMRSRMAEKGQPLLEARGGARNDRMRLVNLATGEDNTQAAEQWIKSQALVTNRSVPTPSRKFDPSDLPF